MKPPERYPVPATTHRVEETVKHSRFIATITPAPCIEAARTFIEAIRAEFPDATHHCWAYAVGAPGTTARSAASDAGEPSGTAGRPMLAVLLGSGLGDVAVVVTRYFGGVKLGRGGLARAYSGVTRRALSEVPRAERIPRVALRLTGPHDAMAAVRHLLARHGAQVTSESFDADATLHVELPADAAEALRADVLATASGRVRVEPA
ncbi:MAG: YigZ family protein [Candidatus Krumholzibacteria bacterium]|nr:YigZ family protein [Candidatus Krumholzibacteria bacterium]